MQFKSKAKDCLLLYWLFQVLKRHQKSKMRTVLFLSLIIAFCVSSGCSNAQSVASIKILIVYLSRTNNTKAIAEIIQGKVGGTLVALELEKPYPEDYKQTVRQVVHENETGYLPP